MSSRYFLLGVNKSVCLRVRNIVSVLRGGEIALSLHISYLQDYSKRNVVWDGFKHGYKSVVGKVFFLKQCQVSHFRSSERTAIDLCT